MDPRRMGFRPPFPGRAARRHASSSAALAPPLHDRQPPGLAISTTARLETRGFPVQACPATCGTSPRTRAGRSACTATTFLRCFLNCRSSGCSRWTALFEPTRRRCSCGPDGLGSHSFTLETAPPPPARSKAPDPARGPGRCPGACAYALTPRQCTGNLMAEAVNS
eukprot:358829-Chlamydomonas_euryale.AAC.18